MRWKFKFGSCYERVFERKEYLYGEITDIDSTGSRSVYKYKIRRW